MAESAMRISFFQKNPIKCPVCGTEFRKEEMLSGRGRLITKNLTDELRRIYEPSKKAGEIFPLVYPVMVCPICLYSTYNEDFQTIKEEKVPMVLSQQAKREFEIKNIFPDIDFRKQRGLYTGAASYILAIGSYSFIDKEYAPTFKKGLSSLRAAWVFDDLHKKYPHQKYDRLKIMMYKKAIGYYDRSIKFGQTGEEGIDAIKTFGPDLDKNYGYQGFLFMASLMLFKYGDQRDKGERIAKLQNAKRIVSRVFGSGKSSKNMPSFILDNAKDLYEKIGEQVKELTVG
ncbi:hypothetical protein LCGC14_2296610 [marine sediment metagenome]|uniref:DUF2225 domain-containing protein n=1 Tax=marine sediment metagenome TaxID=412755 RepID=A0A0F9FJU6_9ZZZZ|nr:DUF2225 domain-containing protein [Spirochaetota bacterium]